MKNTKFRIVLSSLSFIALLFSVAIARGAPVCFNRVSQIVNAKPGKAKTVGFTQLRLSDDPVVAKTDNTTPSTQDDRGIVTQTTEIVEDDTCDCETIIGEPADFPNWALLGLAAIPVGIVLINRKDTPTPTLTTTPAPTATTPTPEPEPEPMTILLFGTGLAGIGIVVRKRIRGTSDNDKYNFED